MRSQLARHVLRRLLAGDLPAFLPPTLIRSRPTFRKYPVGSRVARTQQRRTFFNLFEKPPRVLKELSSEPGYDVLLKFNAAGNNVRPPTRVELVKAWRDLFAYKIRQGKVVNSTQALCAHRALTYLCDQITRSRDEQLTADDLRNARDCLLVPPRDDFTNHADCLTAIFKELRTRNAQVPKDFSASLLSLSQYGRALEARDSLFEYLAQTANKESESTRLSYFIPIIRGLAKEGHEQELLDLAAQAKKAGVEYDPNFHNIMTSYFADKDNIGETKHWFNKPIHNKLPPASMTLYKVLQFALRNNEKEWAMGIYQDLISKLESGPLRYNKPCWDTSLQWAVLLLGKGIDHIEHMIKVAQEHTREKPSSQPNIGTINSLVKVAIDKKDPYLAERLMALSYKLGFQPNYKTYMLQLEYRVLAGDLNGAFAVYHLLQDLDVTTKDRALPVLNSFIRALCAAPSPNHDRVLEVTSYLEERSVTLEPETVVSLCMAFLKNDEKFEVIDTLSLHTFHYSINQRQMVRKAFVDYCLDKNYSTARVWDAYALLRQFFPEVEQEHRAAIMDAFFERRRADMATHVFGHMRAHDNPQIRPVLETYVRFFEGIGKAPDEESLRTVHNMLKVDTTIQPNTRLYNAIMIGYTACELKYKALDFWTEITTSPEGPTYASLEIVFRTYEITSDGDKLADELWAKIKRMDIDVPQHVYIAYIATTAAHGHLREAKLLLEDADNVVGKRPNFHDLGTVFNALPSDAMKKEFEVWAAVEYPREWAALNNMYAKRSREGLAVFKIGRAWKA